MWNERKKILVQRYFPRQYRQKIMEHMVRTVVWPEKTASPQVTVFCVVVVFGE